MCRTEGVPEPTARLTWRPVPGSVAVQFQGGPWDGVVMPMPEPLPDRMPIATAFQSDPPASWRCAYVLVTRESGARFYTVESEETVFLHDWRRP